MRVEYECVSCSEEEKGVEGEDYVTERLLANRSFMIPLRHIIESECHVSSED